MESIFAREPDMERGEVELDAWVSAFGMRVDEVRAGPGKKRRRRR